MSDRAKFYSLAAALALALFALPLAGCRVSPPPQKGGQSSMTLAGPVVPPAAHFVAPENPKTPSRQTIERTTIREFFTPRLNGGAAPETGVGQSEEVSVARPAEHADAPTLAREEIVERAATELGTSWEDKVRELAARLANTRPGRWVGVALLVLGPVIGWKIGWKINGLIAGGVGLLLVVLSMVVPGNEAWFGLGGLIVPALVGYVYYRARYDANKDGIPDRLQRGNLRDLNPPSAST